jgi:membrane-associated phospholipid phosphatase
MRNFAVFVLIFFSFQQVFSQNLDIRILNALNSPGYQTGDNTLKFISNSTSALVVGVPLGVGLAGLIRRDTNMVWNSAWMCATALLNYGITTSTKQFVNRMRPYDRYSFIENKLIEDNASFPSGHTSTSFALATSISLTYPKWYIIVPSYLWAGSVAYSRLQLGMHYPSDVIAGALIGTGCAYLCYIGNKWLRKKYKPKGLLLIM